MGKAVMFRNKQKRFPGPRRVALKYDGATYHITIQEVAMFKFKAEWIRPVVEENAQYQIKYHTKADHLEAYAESGIRAQALLLKKIDPSGITVVRDTNGNQLA